MLYERLLEIKPLGGYRLHKGISPGRSKRVGFYSILFTQYHKLIIQAVPKDIQARREGGHLPG